MILSIPFKGDNYKTCVKYYQLNYKRHISDNVKKEVYDVIGRLRMISLDVFNHIKQYVTSKNISLTKIEYHIQTIKNTYLNKFLNMDYVFGIKKNKFLSIVDDVFNTYYDEIKDTIVNNDISLDSLLSKLRDLFKRYNKIISNCMDNFENFSFENNQDLIKQLISIGIHEKDAILVDDCYNKSKEINEKFVFVTQDKGIITCSKDAFELLDSKIHFSKPNSFLDR